MSRKRHQRRANKSCAIVGDGKTEVWYFQMMKKHSVCNFDIRPKLPQDKSIAEQHEQVLSLCRTHDQVIWLVDYDTIRAEDGKHRKGTQKTSERFKNYYNKLKGNEQLEILLVNPCLEYWFLLHFKDTSKFFAECKGAKIALKKEWKTFEKTEKFFKKQNDDIYKHLLSHLPSAIERAKRLGTFDIQEPNKAVCELYKLFDILEIKL